MDIIKTYGPDYPIIKISKPKIIVRTASDLVHIDCHRHLILFAQSIINVYKTKTSPEHSIQLNDIYCHKDFIYVLIDSIQKQDTPPKHMDSLSSESLEHSACLPLQLSNEDLLLIKSDYESKFSYAWIDDI